MKSSVISFIVLVVILFLSCIPQKNLEYLHDPVMTENIYELQKSDKNIIKPNDELYINVSSFDDLSFNYFATEGGFRQGYSDELSLSLISYTVDKEGSIYFPILSNVELAGLSIEEARSKLTELLSDYLNQPTVIMKFAYKKITLIGEVNRPGNYNYAKDELTIFEALSLAGDISVHGNKKETILLRKSGDKITKKQIDLTSDEIVFNEYYYVMPDDVIYVKPRRSLKWNIVSVPISLILSTLTASLLIVDFFSKR